ncbi:hypothetical protein CPLU01_15634 [Colletotrichum plurivorum]|uniref:Uncharacterized protein n=1 Tax=Colletotrichum plurivorum TaxID=2175906 RepID=A0A8H6J9W2_9PEZI|nr:hypothetical protein CPLU01_15634 [Colletotrichum plurivorum]
MLSLASMRDHRRLKSAIAWEKHQDPALNGNCTYPYALPRKCPRLCAPLGGDRTGGRTRYEGCAPIQQEAVLLPQHEGFHSRTQDYFSLEGGTNARKQRRTMDHEGPRMGSTTGRLCHGPTCLCFRRDRGASRLSGAQTGGGRTEDVGHSPSHDAQEKDLMVMW